MADLEFATVTTPPGELVLPRPAVGEPTSGIGRLNLDPDWLVTEYVAKDRSARDMAEERGTTNHTIIRALRSLGVEIRPSAVSRPVVPGRDWLIARYGPETGSASQLAKEIGCTTKAVVNALAKHGIALSTVDQAARMRASSRPLSAAEIEARYRQALTRFAPGNPLGRSMLRRPPEPTQSLLLALDEALTDDDARALLVVQPQHTFADLAEAIVREFFEDRFHLAEFWVDQAGRVTQGRWGRHAANTLSFKDGIQVVMKDWDGGRDDYREDDDLPVDGDVERVTSCIGIGWFFWFRFDFGDEWWFAIRAVAVAPAGQPQARYPEVVAPPLTRYAQYRS